MEIKILRLKPILFMSSILFDFFWSSKPASTQTNTTENGVAVRMLPTPEVWHNKVMA